MKFSRAYPYLALLALTVASRGRAFLISRGDANVDTLYHVGAVWLHGTLPYLSAWEYKPPGIFALCAAGLLTFHSAALAGAVLGTLAVFVTALAAAALVRGLVLPEEAAVAGIIAAIGVVLFSVEDQGVLGDAEVYVNACVTLAFAAVVNGGRTRRAVFAALAAACALQMKLIAVPLIALVAFELVRRAPGARLRSVAIFTAIVAAPFVLEAALYARAGALPALWDANGGATWRRLLAVRGGVRSDNAAQWLTQIRVLTPALELAPFVAFRAVRKRYAFVWAWFAVALAAVGAAGEFYDRQFLLLVPPVVVLAAPVLAGFARGLRRGTSLLVSAFVLTFALHGYYEVAQSARILVQRSALHAPDFQRGHYPLVLAALRAQAGSRRSLYVLEDSPMLYDDLGVPVPTRYAFSANLLETRMWPMLGLPGRDELARVLGTHPRVIAVRNIDGRFDAAAIALVRRTLRERYHVVARADGTAIYVLRH